MNKGAVVLIGVVVAGCKRHEDAAATPEFTAVAASASAQNVAATAPSDTASAAPVASLAPSASAASSGAATSGMIGLIATGGSADPKMPVDSVRGNMWGDTIGDSFGAGGLGLRGMGDAGAPGEGIGLGNIGTLGHGAGTGTGQGFGNGSGRLGGAHAGHAPSIRQGATTVNGRLPPEVIQRIVRQNFGRFRLCYEDGLSRDPKLAGQVAVKFVIDASGAVSTVRSDPSTTLSDASAVQCIVRAFGNLSFPQPEGGIVTVIYPLVFAPGDAP